MLSIMRTRYLVRASLLAAGLFLFTGGVASADQWNERTTFRFSEPVMVPGTTLQPGSYVFRLMDSQSSRHLVEISREGTGEAIALVQAVPMRRDEPKGDVVVKFNPTEPGVPVAMKGWFYPGSLYGHEFVFSDDEARKIAQRTKTIVLSVDVPGSDLQKGTLRRYDASGVASAYLPDQTAVASWEVWDKNRRASATVLRGTATGDRAQATAPVMQSDARGRRVKIDELEDNPTMFVGKTVTVDAQVEDVYGPRVFTIDEPNWGDLEGELLVYVPASLAAVVREDDRISVTGTVKKFVKSDFEGQWGWEDIDDATEVKLGKRPVLVASSIVGGNDNTAKVVKVEMSGQPVGAAGDKPSRSSAGTTTGTTTGTSGSVTSAKAVTDAASLGRATSDMVGRHVSLDRVRVDAIGQHHGFFVTAGNRTVFVLPSPSERPGLAKGDTVSLQGVVLQMPKFRKDRLKSDSNVPFNDAIYVYATTITR